MSQNPIISQSFLLEILRELGGRANPSQVDRFLRKRYPLLKRGESNISSRLLAMKKWHDVEWDNKTREYYIPKSASSTSA